MSNSSVEWWSLANLDGSNEMSLHQWNWAITTVGGSRYDLPPRRGSDMIIAYRPGQIHRRKVPDARQVTLLMFMVGWDAEGKTAPGADTLLQWNDNWDTLRRAVYRNYLLTDQRLRLIRRHFLTVPEFPTSRNGDICIQGDPGVPNPGKRLLTAFANAEMTGQMQPAMTGRFRSDFQLDFTLSDPYFHGPEVDVTMHANAPAYYIWNDGFDAVGAGYCQVDLVGPLVNPVITNHSTNPDSWVKYTGTIPSGKTVRLVMNKFSCEQLGTPNVNKIGNISSYGARYWVNLLPGTNKMSLKADSGSALGKAVLAFRPPYV